MLCELFLKFCENKRLFLTSKQTAIRQSFDIACLGAIEIDTSAGWFPEGRKSGPRMAAERGADAGPPGPALRLAEIEVGGDVHRIILDGVAVPEGLSAHAVRKLFMTEYDALRRLLAPALADRGPFTGDGSESVKHLLLVLDDPDADPDELTGGVDPAGVTVIHRTVAEPHREQYPDPERPILRISDGRIQRFDSEFQTFDPPWVGERAGTTLTAGNKLFVSNASAVRSVLRRTNAILTCDMVLQ